MAASDYNKKKDLDVTSVTGTPTLTAFPAYVKLVDGNDSTTGTGDIVIDMANVNGPEDIAIYDSTDTLVDYYIETDTVDGTTTTVEIWLRDSITRDGTEQLRVYYGDGPASSEAVTEATVWDGVSGLELRQDLNEAAAPFEDSTSNNHDSTAVDGTTQVAGEFGDARNSDGNDDRIELDTVSNIFDTGGTLMFWAETNSTTNQQRTLNNNQNWDFQLNNVDNGDPSLLVVYSSNNGRWSANANWSTNTWYHTAITFDASSTSNDPTFYHDGSTVTVVENITPSGTLNNTAEEFTLFNVTGGGTSNVHDGDLDEVHAYNEIKSADYIKAHYDMSPKAGQTLFSQQAAESTATPGDFDVTKTGDFSSEAGTPTVSNPVITVRVEGTGTDSTGNGLLTIDESGTTIDGQEDVAFYDESDTLLPYSWTKFDTTNDVYVAKVRVPSMVLDGTQGIKLAFGNGPSDESTTMATVYGSLPNINTALPLDETGAATTASDYSGNSHDMSINGVTLEQADPFGDSLAFSFDGADDDLKPSGHSYGTLATSLNQCVFSFWVKSSDTTSDSFTFGGRDTDSSAYRLELVRTNFDNGGTDDAGDLGVRIDDNSGNQITGTAVGGATVFDGSWHHVIIKIDGDNATSGDNIQAWLDGSSMTTTVDVDQTLSDLVAFPSGDEPWIGEFNNNGTDDGFPFNGDIDEFRIYTDNTHADGDWSTVHYKQSSTAGWTLISWNAASNTGATTATASKAGLTFTANTGQVTKTLTGNVNLDTVDVQGADVYAYDNSDEEFFDKVETDANGDYTINNAFIGHEYLVAVDYDDGTDRFGDEKSIVID